MAESSTEAADVQGFGGFLGGLGLGLVPFAGVGEQVLEDGGVIGHGTPAAQRGLAAGQILTGIFTMVGGVAGEVLGGAATVTGLGAAVGVPAILVSTTLVVGGAANVMAGLRGLTQSMSSGGGASGGERAGKRFTRAGKRDVKAENAAAHGGQTTCEGCKKTTVPAEQSKSGVTPPGNETQVDHITARAKGGNGSPDNGQVLCRDCNLKKGSR